MASAVVASSRRYTANCQKSRVGGGTPFNSLDTFVPLIDLFLLSFFLLVTSFQPSVLSLRTKAFSAKEVILTDWPISLAAAITAALSFAVFEAVVVFGVVAGVVVVVADGVAAGVVVTDPPAVFEIVVTVEIGVDDAADGDVGGAGEAVDERIVVAAD